MDPNLTTITSPRAARSLHEICEAARGGNCGPFCGAQLPRRAASQMSWSERAAGGLVIVVRLVSTVFLLW